MSDLKQVAEMPVQRLDTDTLVELVEEWGRKRSILSGSTPNGQFAKTLEEVGELADALKNQNDEEIVDAIGDITVTLILLSRLCGTNFSNCLHAAYDQIKDRKGRLIDGQFVKEETLKAQGLPLEEEDDFDEPLGSRQCDADAEQCTSCE